nr:hypothetical protein [uncultured Flavobacterium sp.]
MKNKKLTLQDQYNSFLYKLMEKYLFLTAKEVNEKLMDEFKITGENSRKIVARTLQKEIIKSSKPSTFGNGQFIYYSNNYTLDIEDIKSIVSISRPPIYRLLELLQLNDGIISYFEALKITAAPHTESSSKISTLEDIVKILYRLDLAYEKRDDNHNVYILLKEYKQELQINHEDFLMKMHFQKMITDCNLVPDIMRWLLNSNIIDNNTFIYRDKRTPNLGIIHNNLYWDAYAYTKSTGINEVLGAKADSVEKQTLVVLDIVLATDYSQIHLDAFLDRIQININSVKIKKRKTLPIIIYRDCSKEVFFKMRKNGIISFSISAIFGTTIYDVIRKTSQLPILLNHDNLDSSVESILNTIKNSGQDSALKDLRGTLFEYLMYPFLKNLYSDAKIEQNKILKKGDRKHEFDYIITASHPDEIIFVELKGLRDGTFINLGDEKKKATLKWFFKKSMGLAKEIYKDQADSINIKAIFITSAGFWKDTSEFISQMNNSSFKSSKLNTVIDRTELIKLLSERGFLNEVRMIEKYYSKMEEDDVLINRTIEDDLPFGSDMEKDEVFLKELDDLMK